MAKTDTVEPEVASTDPSAPENKGKLVVLTSLFVARTSDKGTATRRYKRGQEFTPVDGVHDVKALIAAKILGRVGADGSGVAPTTALVLTQTQNRLIGQDSPVLTLGSQPFEVAKTEDDGHEHKASKK